MIYTISKDLYAFIQEIVTFMGGAPVFEVRSEKLVLWWKTAESRLFIVSPSECGCVYVCGGVGRADEPDFEYYALWKPHEDRGAHGTLEPGDEDLVPDLGFPGSTLVH